MSQEFKRNSYFPNNPWKDVLCNFLFIEHTQPGRESRIQAFSACLGSKPYWAITRQFYQRDFKQALDKTVSWETQDSVSKWAAQALGNSSSFPTSNVALYPLLSCWAMHLHSCIISQFQRAEGVLMPILPVIEVLCFPLGKRLDPFQYTGKEGAEKGAETTFHAS